MNLTLASLERQGYAHVSLASNLLMNISLAVRQWEYFCGAPSRTKSAFQYENGVGYEEKLNTKADIDLKENFHYTLDSHSSFFAVAKRIHRDAGDRDRFGMFLNCSKLLMCAMRPVIHEVAGCLEREYGLSGLATEVAEGESEWCLRYLHYFGDRNVGEEIAAPHADKGGITFHVYESESGLEYLPYDTPMERNPKWRSMPLARNTTVVIPGMQLQLKSDGRLKALCHRVVANTKTAYLGRYSVVCFVPFVRSPRYNKGVAGRLQAFPPGFNYSMPPDELTKLFV